MRNRVSFSYVNNYRTDWQTYSNTVFFDYMPSVANAGDIYKNKVKYTYIGKTGWTYIHHDLGTTYAQTNGSTEKVCLYENEYERYKYVIDNLGDDRNNNKEISTKTYKYGSSANSVVPVEENIYTYINIDKNSYSLFPNFVEGITGHEYEYNKLAYSYSTNNMVADGGTLMFNDNQSGQHLSTNPLDVLYNIRGTQDGKRLIGIGFAVSTGETSIFAGVNYTDILDIFVYDEDYNVVNEQDIYDSLVVTLPGVEEPNVYSTHAYSNHLTLSINKANKHIGAVLVKISLDWKNNKFNVYHTLNFANIINEINRINNIYYSVNNNERISENWHTQLLEGDLINSAYISTIPERANDTVTLTINNHLSANYTGSSEKTNHSSAPFEYEFNGQKVLSINNYYDSLTNNVSYNANFGGNNINIPVRIFKFVPDNIKFNYKDNDNNSIDFAGNDVIEMSDTNDTNKKNIYASFDIAKHDNEKYIFPITKNGEYNIVESYYCRYNSTNETNAEKHYDISNSELKYNNNYNSYSFNYNITVPGKYDFACHMKNGDVDRDVLLHTFECYNTNKLYKTIITYEGASNINILMDYVGSYTVDESYLTTYNLNANGVDTTVKVPKFSFHEWEYSHAYIDINENINSYPSNIGLLYGKKVSFDLNNDGVVDDTDKNLIYNEILNPTEYVPQYDLNHDGYINVSDITTLNNYFINNTTIISPIVNVSENENINEQCEIAFINNNNNYQILNNNYKIQVRKIYIASDISVNNTQPTSIGCIATPHIEEIYVGNYSNTQYNVNLDLSKYAGDSVTIKIKSKIYCGPFNSSGSVDQSPCKNFKIDLPDDGLIPIGTDDNYFTNQNTSILFDDASYQLTTTLSINKNSWINMYGTDTPEFKYQLKLTRKQTSDYSEDYWDAIGFKDGLINYKIKISNNEIQGESLIGLQNMLLFTNVVNNNPEKTNYYDYEFISDTNGITDLNNCEKITVKFNGTQSTSSNGEFVFENKLTIKRILVGTTVYIRFIPTTNNDINEHVEVTLTAEHNLSNTKTIRVWLKSVNITCKDNELCYIKDINSNNKLYKEILLANNPNTSIHRYDNIFIEKFCDIDNMSNNNENMLYDYTFDNNGNIIFEMANSFVHNSVTYSETNVPDGIKCSFNLTNIIHDKNTKVFIPTSTSIRYKLLNQTNVIYDSGNLTISEYTVNQNYKLFTNGVQNAHGVDPETTLY